MSEQYRAEHSIPSRVLGHYMRDWLDPFLDVILDIKSENKRSPGDAV
jgi:hypothetical protein